MMDLVWVWVTTKQKPQISTPGCQGIYPGSRCICINWYILSGAAFKICWVLPCLSSTAEVLWLLLQRKVQEALGKEQLKRTLWSRLLIVWVGDGIAYSRRQERTFGSLKKSKVQIWLSNLLQPENPALNTEIYSKWKKLFYIDVNSYVIEFLWGHNCLDVCTFPGTILYLPKWSVEKAEWPALAGCASGLIIALFMGIFLLCPVLGTASFPDSNFHHWPGPGHV